MEKPVKGIHHLDPPLRTFDSCEEMIFGKHEFIIGELVVKFGILRGSKGVG